MMALDQVEAAGGFQIVYADPPWSYADKGCNGAAEKQYATMTLEEIRCLPISRLASKNAALFLWATYPLIREALSVIEAWGFEYKSIAFQWLKLYPSGKPFFGLGRWTRGNTEPCLLAVRGRPHRIDAGVSQLISEEIIAAPVGRHSAKPPETRERIMRLMGDLPAIELFARESAPGWDRWGNECESTVQL